MSWNEYFTEYLRITFIVTGVYFAGWVLFKGIVRILTDLEEKPISKTNKKVRKR